MQYILLYFPRQAFWLSLNMLMVSRSMFHVWYISDRVVFVQASNVTWYRHDSYMIHSWFIHNSFMIQAWYIYDTGMIHLWYRHGTFMIQAWYIYDTGMIHSGCIYIQVLTVHYTFLYLPNSSFDFQLILLMVSLSICYISDAFMIRTWYIPVSQKMYTKLIKFDLKLITSINNM